MPITAVFFTFGVTLTEWVERGLIGRELELYRDLGIKGDRFWFFTYDDSLDRTLLEALPPGPFRFFPKRGPWRHNALYSLILPFVYRRELKKARLFKSNQMNGSWTAILAGLLLNRPVLVRQGHILSFQRAGRGARWKARLFYRLVEEMAYRLATHVTFPKEDDLHVAGVRRAGLKQRASVLPNHVDIDRFKPKRGEAGSANRLLFVGRLMPQKNVHALLEAVAPLKEFSLSIVGTGLEREALEERCQRGDLAGRVRLLGPVPNEAVTALMQEASIFVLPSLYEGLPKVLLEAMACGLPVVASRVKGIREVVDDGRTGLLVRPEPEAIRAAIVRLGKNARLRLRLGDAARKEVERRYSLKHVAALERRLHAFLAGG